MKDFRSVVMVTFSAVSLRNRRWAGAGSVTSARRASGARAAASGGRRERAGGIATPGGRCGGRGGGRGGGERAARGGGGAGGGAGGRGSSQLQADDAWAGGGAQRVVDDARGDGFGAIRSEERRVGKEGRSR